MKKNFNGTKPQSNPNRINNGDGGGSKGLVVFLLNVIIFSCLVGIWAFAWDFFYRADNPLPFYSKGTWLLYVLYAIMFMLFTSVFGGLRIGYYRKANVFFSGVIASIFTNALIYIPISLLFRKLILIHPIILMTLADILAVMLWVNFANFIYFRLFPPYTMLMVYGRKPLTESLVYKIAARSEKYRICETQKLGNDIESIKEKILEYKAVILSDIPANERNELIKFCYENDVRTYTTPKISDILVRSAEDITLFDSPLLLIRNSSISPTQIRVKRAIDLIASFIGLVIASPFMLLTALIIKLYDRGPVLYKQDRLTLDGKVFQVYKFRSMIVDAEKKSGARLASENDDRITPVGKLIRKIRFDELPQLLNIFKGDMSIVGPRPERPEIAKEYEKSMSEFSYRLKMKAGLTGYAQVIGKYNTTPYDKLKMDLMYITNYSLRMDFKLMLMTLKILFVSESTEGIEEGEKTPEITSKDSENPTDHADH